MACGNARREAYTAGGEATLLSLEILNVDAFVFISAGAAPRAPLQARRSGSSGVRERAHSHGMARRGTWEAPYLSTRKGRNMDPWPQQRVRARPCLRGTGSEQAGTAWYRLAKQ